MVYAKGCEHRAVIKKKKNRTQMHFRIVVAPNSVVWYELTEIRNKIKKKFIVK